MDDVYQETPKYLESVGITVSRSAAMMKMKMKARRCNCVALLSVLYICMCRWI